jgi:biotin carboxyl carrier protein
VSALIDAPPNRPPARAGQGVRAEGGAAQAPPAPVRSAGAGGAVAVAAGASRDPATTVTATASGAARAAPATAIATASAASPGASPPDPADAQALLELIAAIGACTRFDDAAATLCTRLAASVGASRVVLGWRTRGRAPTRPVALSGAGVPDWDGETGARLAAAMDEAVGQSRALACPGPSGARGLLRAHESLRRAGGAAAVVTVPLAHGGQAPGALLAEFERAPPLDAAARLEAAAALAAPWLVLLRGRRPGIAARLLGKRERRSPFALGAAGVAALALLAGAVVPIDASVSAQARVEGAVQRTVAAPIRGYLKAVRARPGDTVIEGQLLAELGDRELDLDRARYASELSQHEAAAATAMARGERAAMAVAQSRADETRARLALVASQLERIQLRAPIDGVLIQGDLWQQVGAPVERGQSMFVMAPARRHRVIVELDERDVRRVAVGQAGRIALSALPWQSMPLRVERVAPAATALDGRNVFELEAAVSGAADALRPGLRGVAHLEDGRRPLFVQWARRAGDALGPLAWRWLP